MSDLIDFTPLPEDHLRAEVRAAIEQAFAAYDALVAALPESGEDR